MTVLFFAILLLIVAFIAGFLGSLTGLGGGAIIIPVLVLLFHVNIHYAMGASLVSVIATSSGAAAAMARQDFTNIRVGIFLEISAVIGALIGALLIAYVSKTYLAILFSLVMFFSAYLTLRRKKTPAEKVKCHRWAEYFKLGDSYFQNNEWQSYTVQHVPYGLLLMFAAGILSGLLGIGSGALNVLAMDQILRLPYKVVTTTSNFMIGVTAAVSAGIYFSQGYINPVITFPVMIGVLVGSFSGAKILPLINNRILRLIFSIIICFIGLQMFYKAVTGSI